MAHASREMRRFNHLLSETDAAYHEFAVKLGLSDSCMHILYTLYENGNSCLLRDICYLTGMTKQTLHSAIKKLEHDGVLCAEDAPTRGKRIRLTEKGEQLAEHTASKVIDAENRIFSSWEPPDVEKYLALTERFLNELREEAKKLP